VTNIPRPSKTTHSLIKPSAIDYQATLTLEPITENHTVTGKHLLPLKGFWGRCINIPTISALRPKTPINQKPVCHMSTSPELVTLFSIVAINIWLLRSREECPISTALLRSASRRSETGAPRRRLSDLDCDRIACLSRAEDNDLMDTWSDPCW